MMLLYSFTTYLIEQNSVTYVDPGLMLGVLLLVQYKRLLTQGQSLPYKQPLYNHITTPMVMSLNSLYKLDEITFDNIYKDTIS